MSSLTSFILQEFEPDCERHRSLKTDL